MYFLLLLVDCGHPFGLLNYVSLTGMATAVCKIFQYINLTCRSPLLLKLFAQKNLYNLKVK